MLSDRPAPAARAEKPGKHAVAPVEDLMREHGVLRRVMLGDQGCERTVVEVARLEQGFGLGDPARLTPAP